METGLATRDVDMVLKNIGETDAYPLTLPLELLNNKLIYGMEYMSPALHMKLQICQ
jgi:hypothetical protein